MGKKEIILLLTVILLSLGVLLGTRLMNKEKASNGTVNVYVDGKLYASFPLENGKTFTVHQEDGSENIIRMTENGFYMEYSTCDNQLCVQQGEVTEENWQNRALGTHVLCLPNRVDVELAVENGDVNPDVPDV